MTRRVPKIHPPRYLHAWCPHAKVTLEYVVSGPHGITDLFCPRCGDHHSVLGSSVSALKGAEAARASLIKPPGKKGG